MGWDGYWSWFASPEDKMTYFVKLMKTIATPPEKDDDSFNFKPESEVRKIDSFDDRLLKDEIVLTAWLRGKTADGRFL